MTLSLSLLHHILSLSLLLTLTSSATAPVMFPSSSCSDKLVAFSTCLPYVAASPNNLTDSPPPQCCDDVSAAFADGSAICLCYFVLRPKILGFPLNATKLLSLTSVCPHKEKDSKANFSIGALCSESAALPPLHSITDPSNPTPRSGANSPPPPLMGSSEESSDSSPTEEPEDDYLPSQPNLSTNPTTISSARERIYRISWTLLSVPVFVFTSL